MVRIIITRRISLLQPTPPKIQPFPQYLSRLSRPSTIAAPPLERPESGGAPCTYIQRSLMLRKSDYEHILDIIHIAYSAQCREELFRAVFEKLQTVINLSSAAYIPWNPETHDFSSTDTSF